MTILRLTRAAAETLVRSIHRSCRGPHAPTAGAARRHVTAWWKADTEAGTLSEADRDTRVAVLAAASSVAAVIAQLLTLDEHDRAKFVDREFRIPCGHDFNDTILAGPLDGDEHAYECPRCGQQGTYIAPLFDLADDED